MTGNQLEKKLYEFKDKMIKIFVVILLTLPLFAIEIPKSLDHYYEKGIEVEFIELFDPGYIKLKFPDGETLDAEYNSIEYETLDEWKQEQDKANKRPILILEYTLKEGAIIHDKESKVYVRLRGEIYKYLINNATALCTEELYSTSEMVSCMGLALHAWDTELNRLYKALGGNKNTSLKKAQMAWLKYRDAQQEALTKEYGSRLGTIWRLTAQSLINDITENQVHVLEMMNSKVP